MTKLFFGSFVACALLAFLQLMIFLSAYLRGEIAVYNDVILFASGTASSILLTSIFFSLKAKIAALAVFAVTTVSDYVWEIIISPINPESMSFSESIFQGLLFLIFIFFPILGLFSGISLLRQHAEHIG